MTHHKGFVGIAVLVVVGVMVLGGTGYVALNPEVLERFVPQKAQENSEAQTEQDSEVPDVTFEGKSSVTWQFTDVGEVDGMSQTQVMVLINGTPHEAGTFPGSCSEVGASGGVDGTGLLAGELSAAQCWFAGGGNEIGVFAHEDGGFDLMVGDLSEGSEGAGMFRGDFSIQSTIGL